MVDRIFLDANVLFSIAYGSPGLKRLEEGAEKKHCLLFASNYVLEEAKRNLSNPAQIKRLDDFLANIQIIPEMDPQLPCPIHLPEKDRPVLLAAISIRADYFLTGDITHFGKYFGQRVSGVTICLPRDYLSNRPSVG
jgi:predicted nucleic acid-binding protein